jgi:RND family efflux transporter MFP subunit
MINMNKTKTIITMMSVFFLTLIATGCEKKDDRPPPPPVVVSKPVLKQVTPYLTETGNTVAYNSVDLVARVSGYLDSYNFKDGSMVKKGSLLFVIQPQPYKDQVDEAQATLIADIAEYNYDKTEYQRQLTMYKQNATSLAEVQQWLATRDSAAAAVEGAKANLNNAKITYSYTHVLAPFDGRIGRHLVDPSNLVGNGEATKLASIQQIAPMYVYFNINELDLLKLREMARKANFDTKKLNQLPIYVQLQNEEGYPHVGHLDFAATELEASTGTIQMRGILPNKDLFLIPGLFVRVRLPLGKPTPQLMIPDTSVMYDQIGAYIFIVDKNNVVIQTRVKTGTTEMGRISILQGLKADDQVIIDGIQNATPGNTVTPTEKALT